MAQADTSESTKDGGTMRLTNFEAVELGEALLNAAERAAQDNKTIGIICVNGLMI